MKINHFSLFASTLVLLLSYSCTNHSDELSQEDLDYFNESLNEIASKWNAGDRQPYIDYHISSKMSGPNRETFTGDGVREFMLGFPDSKIELGVSEVWGVSTHANVLGTVDVNADDGSIIDSGKFLQSFTKNEDGNWSLTHVMWNTNLPLPEPCPEEEHGENEDGDSD